MLTPQGLSAIRFDDAGAHETPLIECPTIVPSAESAMVFFPLCLKTGSDYPLLLVPAESGLQVWRHEGRAWKLDGTIAEGLQSTVTGPFGDVAYRLYRFTNLAIGDVNGDGRDDLVIRQVMPDRDQLRLRVYLQDADGRLPAEPSRQFDLTCTVDDWVCLQDMNGDGRLDLVKSSLGPLPGDHAGDVVGQGDRPRVPGRRPRRLARRAHLHFPQARLAGADPDRGHRRGRAAGPGAGLLFVEGPRGDDRRDRVWRLVFDLRVYMAAADGRYPAEPTFVQKVAVCTHGIGLRFDWDILRSSWSLEGDFNGDGRKDLLVRSGKDEASVFFFESPQTGFARKPGVVFRLGSDEDAWLAVRDINGDGISDLMAYVWQKKQLIVFLSRRK